MTKKRSEEVINDTSPAMEEPGISPTFAPPDSADAASPRPPGSSVEDLLYIVSHDLKEPVRTMRSICTRLAKLGLTDEASELVERMRDCSERMFGLVSSVLDVAAAAKSGLPRELVDLRSVMEEVLADLEQLIAESGATIQVSPLPEIEAQPVQMRQLFQNLISNSLKFGRAGRPMNVAIGISRYGWNRIEISVTDDGCGISPARRAEIFGSGAGRTGPYGAGCGIGLLICRKIVEAHKGSIEIESEEGRGTTVTIALPVRQT